MAAGTIWCANRSSRSWSRRATARTKSCATGPRLAPPPSGGERLLLCKDRTGRWFRPGFVNASRTKRRVADRFRRLWRSTKISRASRSPAPRPAARRKAMERGRIVHRLMQSLPDIPQERRTDAIQHFLLRTAKDFSPAERAEIARQVSAILDNKVFAEIFTPGSRPEVSIIGHVPRDGAEPLEVAGQVDRLSFTGDTVLIADYKTDRCRAARRLKKHRRTMSPSLRFTGRCSGVSMPARPYARRWFSPAGRFCLRSPPKPWIRRSKQSFAKF